MSRKEKRRLSLKEAVVGVFIFRLSETFDVVALKRRGGIFVGSGGMSSG